MLLLSIWLILNGLMSLANISFPQSAIILALLATVAGVLILMDR